MQTTPCLLCLCGALSLRSARLCDALWACASKSECTQRRGYGRALQTAALDTTRALGCCQMRSWSSLDKHANYALKLSMGFAVCPALYPMPGAGSISGVYFVRRV